MLSNEKNIPNKQNFETDFNFPVINIRRATNLSESTVNYFLLGLCFAIYSFIWFEWFNVTGDNNKNFTFGIFLVSGICLCVIALYDWYQGRTISFLIDFSFGLLFISYYLYNYLDDIHEEGKAENTNLVALFYILWFAFIFFMLLCSKDKGILFIFDYVVLFVGYVFAFAKNYWRGYQWIGKTTGYIFLVMTAFFWVTGILKLLNDISLFTSNPLVEPPA